MLNFEKQAVSDICETIRSSRFSNDEIAVSFSGGKDSLVVLDLAVRFGIKKAVFCDTTIEFEQTIEYINTIKKFYDVDLTTVKSKLDYFDTVVKIGVPSRRSRWCCDVFKFAPIFKYGKKNGIKIFLTGLRKNESQRRNFYSMIDKNPILPFTQFNPILEWKDEDVWEYINAYNLPYNPLYDKGFKRVGCWCCPYKTNFEWKWLEKNFPKKIEQLNNILENQAKEAKIKDKDKFIGKKGWTSWVSPVRKISIGSITSCKTNTLKNIEVFNLKFNGDIKKYNYKVLRVLPILTDMFWENENKSIKIILEKSKKKKLLMLIEKAINCISCGVCLSQCPVNALKRDDVSIYVNESKCNKCGRCLNGNSKILRGACIVRNYNSKSKMLTELNEITNVIFD